MTRPPETRHSDHQPPRRRSCPRTANTRRIHTRKSNNPDVGGQRVSGVDRPRRGLSLSVGRSECALATTWTEPKAQTAPAKAAHPSYEAASRTHVQATLCLPHTNHPSNPSPGKAALIAGPSLVCAGGSAQEAACPSLSYAYKSTQPTSEEWAEFQTLTCASDVHVCSLTYIRVHRPAGCASSGQEDPGPERKGLRVRTVTRVCGSQKRPHARHGGGKGKALGLTHRCRPPRGPGGEQS